jgi:pimeloyl-ACP methyl ester carboxylesterase
LRWSAVLLAACATALTAPAASALAAGPAFAAAPCPADVFSPSVSIECGSITVPERRSRPQGPTITVAAAIVHAPTSAPTADPIVFLDGGPSFGAINSFAVDFYFGGASYVQDRDVILVDTRGTGLSQPRLGCPEFDEASDASWYSKPFADSRRAEEFTTAVAACRDRLRGEGVDLSAYDSAESAADLDDLRRALGYEQWNLVAWSADGILGLTYMRLFGAGIRSAIIDSGQSPQMLGPLDYARGNTEVLERVFAGCAANAACDATYPNIRALFFDLVHRLQHHPARISVPAFRPRPITMLVDGVWFYTDALYEMFPGNAFEPEHIHDLLSEIWRATHGDLAGVMRERAGSGPQTSDNDSFVAEGKTMSYLCRDVIGFITPSDIEQAARDVPELAPDILSPDYALPFGPSGCRIWGAGLADPVQHQPVTSAIPTLVLAGEFDSGGGVPPLITREIPRTLPNSFYYEFPAGAHGQLVDYNNASPCAREIAAQFLDAPTARPDSGCIAQLAPFDFTPPPDAAGMQPRSRRSAGASALAAVGVLRRPAPR